MLNSSTQQIKLICRLFLHLYCFFLLITPGLSSSELIKCKNHNCGIVFAGNDTGIHNKGIIAMQIIKKLAVTSAFVFSASIANATVFNFIDLTEGAGNLGESAWNTLTLTDGSLTMNVNGYSSNPLNGGISRAFAYLDWGNAGLGVCKSANSTGANPDSSTNQCNPSSDDNVTVGEYLAFSFNQDVQIDNFWFNNNHDGGFGAGDLVTIGGSDFAVGTGYVGGNNGIGPFMLGKGSELLVRYKNEEFYISGMEVSTVPEPSTLALVGLGIIGLGLRSRRKLSS